MAFNDRQALVATMTDWLNRNGSTKVAERCLDFITLCEASFNRDPDLRLRQMVKRAKASLSDGLIRLPNDWLEAKQLQINSGDGTPRRLEPCTMEQADDIRAAGHLTNPAKCTIVGQYLEVVPYTKAALEIEMAYYQRLPALAADDSTNWLLQEHPDYYLYGSLVHSAPYLRDDERITTWARALTAARDALILADERATHSGGRLRTRARLRC